LIVNKYKFEAEHKNDILNFFGLEKIVIKHCEFWVSPNIGNLSGLPNFGGIISTTQPLPEVRRIAEDSIHDLRVISESLNYHHKYTA
jgi:hypothetical protein